MSVSMNNVSQVNNPQPIKQPQKKTDEKQKSLTPTKTTVAIGAGLTALAAIGIYFATRGKTGKATQETATEALTGAVTKPFSEIVDGFEGITVDAFKEAGHKFIKGKAYTNSGEKFTGKILHKKSNGTVVVGNYKDSLLQEVNYLKDGKVLEEKTKIYKYKDGILNYVAGYNVGFERVNGPCGEFVNIEINAPMKPGRLSNPYGYYHTVFKKDSKTGLATVGKYYIDPETKICGGFNSIGIYTNEMANEVDWTYRGANFAKIKHTYHPDDGCQCGYLDYLARDSYNKGINNRSIIFIRKSIDFPFKGHGGPVSDLDITFRFNGKRYTYNDCMIKSKEKGSDCGFKFNYHTKEISDVNMDNEEAKDIADFLDRHLNHYLKAKNLKFKREAKTHPAQPKTN